METVTSNTKPESSPILSALSSNHNEGEKHKAQLIRTQTKQASEPASIPPLPSPVVIDIGINLTNKAFSKNWKAVVRRAIDAGVHRIILTGTSIHSSRESLRLAREWNESETGGGIPNLFATVGVHPHEAKSWDEDSLEQLAELLEDPLAVAVGECGLDYHRNFSSNTEQIRAFREQVKLALDRNYPIFVHEREAHGDLLKVLDGVLSPTETPHPKIVVHCFTGTHGEASAYVQRGYCIGFTGTICKKERGAHLRTLLPSLPLEKLMVETDAPYMGFPKKGQKRRCSEPADCIDVAKQLGESIGRPFEDVCEITTQTAMAFFRLPRTQAELPERQNDRAELPKFLRSWRA